MCPNGSQVTFIGITKKLSTIHRPKCKRSLIFNNMVEYGITYQKLKDFLMMQYYHYYCKIPSQEKCKPPPPSPPQSDIILPQETKQKYEEGRVSTNNISTWHSFCALDLLVATSLLSKSISISTIRKNAGIIPMDNVINVILIKQLLHKIFSYGIRCIRNDFIYPLHTTDHNHPVKKFQYKNILN